MSSFLVNQNFPHIKPSTLNDVTVEERVTAIDFVNRHNFVFEEFDHDKMISTFLPNSTVYHTEGIVRGHAEMRIFFQDVYGFFIPGISRSATNHVVDRDEDGGVMVRYQLYLYRHGWPKAEKNNAGVDEVSERGLPAIWWYSPMIDRLQMTSDGWKIYERYLGPSIRNGNLDLTNMPKH
jgi:hypothetical protein